MASSAGAQAVHGDEPLRGGAEDDRRLVAPAVRITVGQRGGMQQFPARLERLNHVFVGLEYMFAGEQLGVGEELAVAADRGCAPRRP